MPCIDAEGDCYEHNFNQIFFRVSDFNIGYCFINCPMIYAVFLSAYKYDPVMIFRMCYILFTTSATQCACT